MYVLKGMYQHKAKYSDNYAPSLIIPVSLANVAQMTSCISICLVNELLNLVCAFEIVALVDSQLLADIGGVGQRSVGSHFGE